MNFSESFSIALTLLSLICLPAYAAGDETPSGMSHDHPGHGQEAPSTTSRAAQDPIPRDDQHQMSMEGHSMSMQGMFGPYSMMREASGTSWQPDSSPHSGIMGMSGAWQTMVHGYLDAIYDHQSGARGDDKSFSASMLMLMAQRSLGSGTLGLRGMFSLDPLMGKAGYPLLLQTGETADGRTPLIDRQHPHNLFMEMAASYSVPVGDRDSTFVYAGLPGEPALRPPAF